MTFTPENNQVVATQIFFVFTPGDMIQIDLTYILEHWLVFENPPTSLVRPFSDFFFFRGASICSVMRCFLLEILKAMGRFQVLPRHRRGDCMRDDSPGLFEHTTWIYLEKKVSVVEKIREFFYCQVIYWELKHS